MRALVKHQKISACAYPPLTSLSNQLIVTEKDRDSLLKKACNILIEARGYEAAWLGFLSDNGAGLPDGFDINATGTLGLRLIKILTEDQLQGNLEVISKEGATFNIEFDTKC